MLISRRVLTLCPFWMQLGKPIDKKRLSQGTQDTWLMTPRVLEPSFTCLTWKCTALGAGSLARVNTA